MTTLRVTQRSMAQQTLAGLQANISRLGQLQQQLSSGRQISKPSDSPTGTVSAMQLRSQIRTNEQWSRNAADGIGWLGTIDQTLSDSLDAVRSARGLVVQGLNTGALSPDARNALAAQVDEIRATVIGLANTNYVDRPVFGGTTSGTKAYDANGVYVGNPPPPVPPIPGGSAGITRSVGADSAVRVDQTGPEVFGAALPAGKDLFSVLATISADLKSGNTTLLSADLTDLDKSMSTMTSKLAAVGANYSRVEQMQQAADNRVITLKSSLSGIEDIDLPKTIVDLQMQQVAYQAALGATQKIITTSLADFLK
jgi:flagellar hook-associated protein 3 FlgL